MEVFDEKLCALQQDMQRKRHLQQQLADLEKRKASLEARAKELKRIRDLEQQDVEELEGRSLTRFFLQITGKLEEKLTREQKEAAEAAVRYDAVAAELADVKRAVDEIRLELNGRLYSVEWTYEQTLQKKKEALLASGDPRAMELLELEEQKGALNARKKELQEAISAGKQALQIAGNIRASLSSAENWGTWDMLGGGGLITHMAKHSHLDDAQSRVESLQVALGRFRTELSDVSVTANLEISIDGFSRFADFWFDGIFADWMVQDKIRASADRVYEISRKIEMVLTRLQQLDDDTARKLETIKTRQEELIRSIPM